MDTVEFDKMFEMEGTNWWYRGRRKLVLQRLEPLWRERGRLRILDIACATGGSFRFLEKYGDVRGIDISHETIRLCQSRGIDRVVRADAMSLPFEDGSFDVILALDALEHFEDDEKAMAEIRRVAKPDAMVVVTVPAFMFLWSPHDEAYHHFRRYTRKELGGKLGEQGLRVEKLSYYSMSLMPPVYLMRKVRSWLQRKKQEEARSDFFLSMPRPVEWFLNAVMQTEIALMQLVNLPFGVSLFCVSRPAERGVSDRAAPNPK